MHYTHRRTMKLASGDSVQGEPGTMMYLTSGMKQRASFEGCCARMCSGEDCCVLNLVATSSDASYAALCPNYPTAKIVPVDMSSPAVGGSLIAQKGAFMASYGDVSIGISFDCNFMRCCCAGLGLVRQKLEGTGTAFLASTGTIVQKVLQAGETIVVDTVSLYSGSAFLKGSNDTAIQTFNGSSKVLFLLFIVQNCVLAFAESCKLDLKRAGGVLGIVGGGEGFFNTTLTGPGLVIICSMNDIIFREALAAPKLYRR